MSAIFLDTNVLLRHLIHDDPKQSTRATDFLHRIEQGEIQARISELVIFESVFTLERGYRQLKTRIREILLPLISMRGIIIPNKQRWKRVFNFYVDLNLPFADAYHVVVMEELKLTEIATFDTDFDRVPGIKRIKL
jgi:predicted nucleic acid-binding protein